MGQFVLPRPAAHPSPGSRSPATRRTKRVHSPLQEEEEEESAVKRPKGIVARLNEKAASLSSPSPPLQQPPSPYSSIDVTGCRPLSCEEVKPAADGKVMDLTDEEEEEDDEEEEDGDEEEDDEEVGVEAGQQAGAEPDKAGAESKAGADVEAYAKLMQALDEGQANAKTVVSDGWWWWWWRRYADMVLAGGCRW